MTTKAKDAKDKGDDIDPTTEAPSSGEGTAPDAIDSLTYDDVKAEIAATINRLSRLQARKAFLEENYARSDNWKEAAKTPLVSDDGISYARVSTHRIVNLTDQNDKLNAHRLELHVDGKVYTHVEETSEGQWIYRFDK